MAKIKLFGLNRLSYQPLFHGILNRPFNSLSHSQKAHWVWIFSKYVSTLPRFEEVLRRPQREGALVQFSLLLALCSVKCYNPECGETERKVAEYNEEG